MRLCRFEIQNFKGIQNASIEWEDIVVLIGENNAGKSTVLQALQLYLSGGAAKDTTLFFDNLADDAHAIELTGHFDQLTPDDLQAQAVRGRTQDGKWILKKRFWLEQATEAETEKGGWKEQYFSYSCEETFQGWPDEERRWENWPANYQDLIREIGAKPSNQSRDRLKDLVRQRKTNLLMQSVPKWVPNPGGGGNWKSNANSVVPHCILVKAVHDATDEALSKDASTYGKIVSLIVERKMLRRPEVQELRKQIEIVLKLFRPDPEHPELQAEEIRDIQRRINERLNQVIGGIASIRTTEPDIKPFLLPNTTLVIKDHKDAVETPIGHQGNGLQRTLIIALLQILAELQAETTSEERAAPATQQRPVVLAVEEPELYMHPQMERKMRDVLYRLATQPGLQVICSTHSPVFLDMAQKHRAIVRVVKNPDRKVNIQQVLTDLFEGDDAKSEHDRLRLVAAFNPVVNEIFFAKRVVLFEEPSAPTAFERAAELTGIFDRHPGARYDVALVDCRGKRSIPMFQKVLNHFGIPYLVLHDEDRSNPTEASVNTKITNALMPGLGTQFMISPENIEGLLGYVPVKRDKPYQAFKKVEELYEASGLPEMFLKAMNMVFFGQETEPTAGQVAR